MKYKIIFSDFDGTISKSDNTVTDNVKAKIASYRAAGGKFVVATGRLFSSILPRIKEIGIDSGEAIVYQGGGVYDIATGKPVYLNVIERSLATEIIREIEKLDYCVPITYFDDRCNCKEVSEAVSMFCSICRIKPYTTPDNIPLWEYMRDNDVQPVKILALLMPQDSERFIAHMRGLFGDKMEFARSHKMIVEIMPHGVNKGVACKKVAQRYGVSADEVICAGDSENDIAMIEYAGLGVATCDAMPALKEKANYISTAPEGECISDIIDRFCGDI